MVEPREWLIRKDGYYYRPNCAGYTTNKFEAGRYTKAEAEREAAVEPWHMKAIHQDDVEDDPVSSRVRMDGEQIAALKARAEAAERALAERAGGGGKQDAIDFLYKHGALTHVAAREAVELLTSNGFEISRRSK